MDFLENLKYLKYSELQKLAKSYGIRANLKASVLLGAIERHVKSIEEGSVNMVGVGMVIPARFNNGHLPQQENELAKAKEEELRRLQSELLAKAANEELMKESLECELRRKEQAEKQLIKLQEELVQRDEANKQMIEQIQSKEAEQHKYLQNLQDELQAQKIASEERLKQEYKQQLELKEQELLQRLSNEKERLTMKRASVERSLQWEMEKKLKDQNSTLQHSLRKEIERLQKVIDQREGERKMMETEFALEMAEEKMSALHVKEELLANFASLLEDEMQCSICNELFIKATSLTCSHSFCEFCLDQWAAVKKDCPVCRAPLTTRYRSTVLDSYIDKMVEHLNEDMRQKRKAIVDERRAEQEKAASKLKASANLERYQNAWLQAVNAARPVVPAVRPLDFGAARHLNNEPAGHRYNVAEDAGRPYDDNRARPRLNNDDTAQPRPYAARFFGSIQNANADRPGLNVNARTFVQAHRFITCYNCGVQGHMARECPNRA